MRKKKRGGGAQGEAERVNKPSRLEFQNGYFIPARGKGNQTFLAAQDAYHGNGICPGHLPKRKRICSKISPARRKAFALVESCR
jgi:hypothetical protein